MIINNTHNMIRIISIIGILKQNMIIIIFKCILISTIICIICS